MTLDDGTRAKASVPSGASRGATRRSNGATETQDGSGASVSGVPYQAFIVTSHPLWLAPSSNNRRSTRSYAISAEGRTNRHSARMDPR